MPETILIIEDDRSVAQLLEDLLGAEGYSVIVEGDGEWGLQTFQHKDVDLLLVDILVPKLIGFDLIAAIRKLEKGAKVPIIVLSGVYRASSHKTTLIDQFGISDYFDKPVDLNELLSGDRRRPRPAEKAEPLARPKDLEVGRPRSAAENPDSRKAGAHAVCGGHRLTVSRACHRSADAPQSELQEDRLSQAGHSGLHQVEHDRRGRSVESWFAKS